MLFACRWAHNALTILLGLIQSRYCKDTTYMSLNPPWLEDMMREGLPEGQELPEPGALSFLCCNLLLLWFA